MANEAVFGPPTKFVKGVPPARLPRPTLPMAGWGGFVEIERTGASEDEPEATWKLEVLQWALDPTITWVEIPMCGGFGAMSRRVVCTDVSWRAILAWDRTGLDTEKDETKKFTAHLDKYDQGWLDGMLLGLPAEKFTVGLRFYLGEPANHPGTDEEGAFYRLPKATLERLQMIDNTNDRKAIQAVANGKVSGPYERWYGAASRGGNEIIF